MKRLLLPLLTAIALPTAVSAESYWLVIVKSSHHGYGLEKIEMKSIDDCNSQGKYLVNSLKEQKVSAGNYLYFSCITGK